MPRIFDNMEQVLLPELKKTLKDSARADFCVGYVNLRGWGQLEQEIEQFTGTEEACCRLLAGMQTTPRAEIQELLRLNGSRSPIDAQEAIRRKRKYVQEFREQLTQGAPNNRDEAALRRLSKQLKSGKVVIKLFLRHTLHAKLYLVYRPQDLVPIVSFLGSSNLTMSGLSKQGELNVDVLDHDATKKLELWFEDKWTDKFCLDISQELAEVIDQSWAKEELTPPYHIYLKMAYHLSQEARAGLAEYDLPREFRDKLFKFQAEAVKIAAHHVNKRGGVMIADVVGLGKTLIATALAKILQDESLLETLIICPKNLVPMWKDYAAEYRLIAEVMPLSRALQELPDLRPYRVVLIDESHNLRNREGKRYRTIREYIEKCNSKCILLSATPYNKSNLDLSAQLRLFIPEDKNLGIRPEQLIRNLGGDLEFNRKHQVDIRSLRAFEFSEYRDDWRDLMKLFTIRRTRSFIKDNYANTDDSGRKYLQFSNGSQSYFPTRIPKTAKFGIVTDDPYTLLYSDRIVDIINTLTLPRYGLGNYELDRPVKAPTEQEQKILDNLSHAGRRLMGFCRTNLFKRLESSGVAFLQSLDRHILRNYIYLHAIAHKLEIPIGTQDAELLDTRTSDEDSDSLLATEFDAEVEGEDSSDVEQEENQAYSDRASRVYKLYATKYKKRFKWIRADLFKPELYDHLLQDAESLTNILNLCPRWDASKDQKLITLANLLTKEHSDRKVLIFTQFADTAKYLESELKKLSISNVGMVTGNTDNPTEVAYRFSPKSNKRTTKYPPNLELRVLVATDVLSEGQNLQDCHIIINYDLPWAIIRLIQRAGRVDRIGQESDQIFCYSFLPAEGVERLIRLRRRLGERLQQNAEVVGTDEQFFEEQDNRIIFDLYNEKLGIMDDAEDNEVDLTSEAYQIWKNATDQNPELKAQIEQMANVSYTTRNHEPTATQPEGVMVYIRTGDGNDALAYIDRQGNSITQSQLAILRLAACSPDTPAIPRNPNHHDLVAEGAKFITVEENTAGGQLGSPKGARFRVYDRLKRYIEHEKAHRPLFVSAELEKAIDEIYRYPLRQSAIDKLNSRFREKINDVDLADLVLAMRTDDCLCVISEDVEEREAQIICSMGLFSYE